ncbi:hypothetical protein HPB47_015249 [Ixodes persulcatus]|uniref:Uncharacterized protein n=1 Tax=Ixodes persulcatus TaxID=34615 RepID=A0AC60QU00_IXOPE|nr:hypothetical protein HPB47_015249 [Ixodes persulcatus]
MRQGRSLILSGDQIQTMSFMPEKVLLFWDWRWLTTALVFLLSYVVVRFYHKVFKYPKGPFPLPIVGNLLTLRNLNELYKVTEGWARKYGDPITLWMGEKPMVVLNTQKLVKEAFIERRHEFAGRFPTKMGELQTLGNHDIMFEDYNPRWKALRKVALAAVRKYAVSESLDTLCCQVVDAYVDSLKEGPNVVDSKVPFEYMIYNIIGMSVYGANVPAAPADLRAKGVIASGVIAGRSSSRRYPSSQEFGARALGSRTSTGLPDHTALHSEGRPDSPLCAICLVRPKRETRGGVRESRPARWRTLSNTIWDEPARSQTTPAGTSAAYAFSGEGNQWLPQSPPP